MIASKAVLEVHCDDESFLTIQEEDAITEAFSRAEDAANEVLPDGFKAKVVES
jgi:hypothetical protein